MSSYIRQKHAASKTSDFVFNQLIPYIGNKRKLLDLIGQALAKTRISPESGTFVDVFAGSGVVGRYAKQSGFAVIANDWEPYAEIINRCYIETNTLPENYTAYLQALNALPPAEGWITRHLCPRDDVDFDPLKERLFFMRKNGQRIDAIRAHLDRLETDPTLRACLLAPLLYEVCYRSNTSGVFKGFHNGWGGQTATALYRIAGDLVLRPPVLHDNERRNAVTRLDAHQLGTWIRQYCGSADIAYFDPPYNQHPYGANYHVLNTVALWDEPELSEEIEGRNKAAIRLDWRTERRSAYNYKAEATHAYATLLQGFPARWLLTSYSTDGNIPLRDLVRINCETGDTRVVMQGYKRYRVSTQRFSTKPLNVEFILICQAGVPCRRTPDAIVREILSLEKTVLEAHPETSSPQPSLFEQLES